MGQNDEDVNTYMNCTAFKKLQNTYCYVNIKSPMYYKLRKNYIK